MFAVYLVMAFLWGVACAPCEAMGENKSKLAELVQDVEKAERVVRNKIKEIPQDATRILLLGATGSGKSALLHELLGVPLIVSISDLGLPVLQAEASLKDVVIDHTANSQTLIPGIIYDEVHKLVYCDCPGFFDTRSKDQEIVNAFAIDQLIAEPTKVKILLVVSGDSIMSNRGYSAKNQFQAVERLIPSMKILTRGVSIVITKGTDVAEALAYLKYLSTDSESTSFLLKFLLENSYRVFSFPAPIQEKYGELYRSFVDKRRVMDFLLDESSTMVDPPHGVALSLKAMSRTFELAVAFGNIESLLFKLTNRIEENFRGETLSGLCNYREGLFRLKSDVLDSPASFVDVALVNIPYPERYADLLEQIESFQALRNFLNRIFAVISNGKPETRISDMKNSLFMSVFADIPSIVQNSVDMCLKELNVLMDMAEENCENERQKLQKEQEEMTKRVEAEQIALEHQKLIGERLRKELEEHREQLVSVKRDSSKEQEDILKLKRVIDDLFLDELEKVREERDALKAKVVEVKKVTYSCNQCREEVKKIVEKKRSFWLDVVCFIDFLLRSSSKNSSDESD